jgi:very-short-patch-repair endonuclease
MELCESPIERIFLEALQAQMIGHPVELLIVEDISAAFDRFGESKFICVPQAQVINPVAARVDFVIFDARRSSVHGTMYAMVVECDGHDYHERTREQAKRDKSRDRAFTNHGFVTHRFTGSEIFNDPRGCADEVIALLEKGIP